MNDLEAARADWNVACARAGAALDALRAAGNPRVGPLYEAWKVACAESRRTSDIWYWQWEQHGRPMSTANIPKRNTEGGD